MATIDPVAAAQAAAAAAAAAKAAAEAAAAAQAAAATQAAETPTGTPKQSTDPVFAAESTRQVLEDTDALGAGDGQMDGTAATSIIGRDAPALFEGQTRETLISMRGISSAIDLHADIEGLALTPRAPDGASIDKSSVSDVLSFVNHPIDYTVRTVKEAGKAVVDALSPHDSEPEQPKEYSGWGWGSAFTGRGSGPGSTAKAEPDADPDADPEASGTIAPSDPDADAGTADPTDPAVSGGVVAQADLDYDGGVAPAAAGSVRGQVAEDAVVAKPKGWIDGEELLRIRTGQVLTGVTGRQDDDDDVIGLGPQGGGTTVNPDPLDGYSSDPDDRRTSVEGSGQYQWVGQSTEALDPVVSPGGLQELEPGVDGNAVNPSGGEGTSASTGAAQASTASAHMSEADAASAAAQNGVLDGYEDALPVLDDVAVESASDVHRGNAYGLEQGHGQGAGHGDHGDGDALEQSDGEGVDP